MGLRQGGVQSKGDLDESFDNLFQSQLVIDVLPYPSSDATINAGVQYLHTVDDPPHHPPQDSRCG